MISVTPVLAEGELSAFDAAPPGYFSFSDYTDVCMIPCLYKPSVLPIRPSTRFVKKANDQMKKATFASSPEV